MNLFITDLWYLFCFLLFQEILRFIWYLSFLLHITHICYMHFLEGRANDFGYLLALRLSVELKFLVTPNGNSWEFYISRDLLQLSCYCLESSYPVRTLNGYLKLSKDYKFIYRKGFICPLPKTNSSIWCQLICCRWRHHLHMI